MGARKSIPQEPPLSFKSWRAVSWKEKQSALEYVNNFSTSIEGLQIRILLHGPSGAGKSSFINSVQSVLHGRMFAHALAANVHSGCFTKKYTTYKIQKGGPENFYPFVFNDTMGLSPQGGVLVEDIKLALMGHVKEGYKFNPESRLSEDDPCFVRAPTDNEKVHVLVCVIPAGTLTVMSADILQKIRDVRVAASELGIPQVVILTKIGEAYPEIREDLKSVYRVTSFKNRMERLSAEVGIPMNCIFPVKNYYEEIDLNNDADSLILSALKNIINFGQDCFNFRMSHTERLD